MISGGSSQKAGANSNQYQVQGDLVVVQGVTEERALEIARQAALDVIASYSAESHEVAETRIGMFDVALVRRLARSDLLGALADPAVQVALRKAQLGAASSERESDYELLAALIEDRVKRSSERPVRSGIDRAIEVVDQLDDTALAGLTVLHSASSVVSSSPGIEPGLSSMERLLNQLMEGRELPEGPEWIEHLDVLGAVRIETAQSFLKFDDFWPRKSLGYVAPGVAAGSEEEERGREEMARLGIQMSPVPDHELRPGFRRLPVAHEDGLKRMLSRLAHRPQGDVDGALRVARDIFGLGVENPDAKAEYMRRVREQPAHARLAEWWDSLPFYCAVTPVGRVLARADAERLDTAKLLPPL